MLEIYSVNLTALGTTENVTFNNVTTRTNHTAVLNPDKQTVSLNVAGSYLVTFTGTATTTAAGDVSFQLYANNVAVPQTAVETTTGAGDIANVSFTTIINVASAPSPQTATLRVEYTGSAGTIDMADLVIMKVR